MRKKPGLQLAAAPAPVGPALGVPRYHCSPEHKTHPGSWGAAQWHPRRPELQPCPTDILSDAVPQAWLEQALAYSPCWEPDHDDGPNEPPRCLYWYVATRQAFFVARKTQLAGQGGQGIEYKGFPAYDHQITEEMAARFLRDERIPQNVYERLRRARRAAARGA